MPALAGNTQMCQAISESHEILFRQVHPSFFDQGEPSSQTFAPTPKDNNKLSVDRSSLTSAREAYELFTGNGHLSVAVYGLSVGDFSEEKIETFPDPIPPSDGNAANPAHAYADYSQHTGNQQKNKAKRLKRKAISRGCLFAPEALKHTTAQTSSDDPDIGRDDGRDASAK